MANANMIKALKLIVEAYNTCSDDLSLNLKEQLRDMTEDFAVFTDRVIQVGGGKLYILTHEEYQENLRDTNDAILSDDPTNHLEEEEEELGLLDEC